MYNRPMPFQLRSDVPLVPTSVLGPYRDSDYWALPDEPRCELLYGELVVTPSPSAVHQVAALHLARLLDDHANTCGGLAVTAPSDVALFDHSVVQPDVIFWSTPRLGAGGKRFAGVPDLVVEVLSPGSVRRDRIWKLKLYAEAGVREYWLVDPEARSFEHLVLRDERYEVRIPDEGVYRSPAIPGLELDLAAFWSEVERRLARVRA